MGWNVMCGTCILRVTLLLHNLFSNLNMNLFLEYYGCSTNQNGTTLDEFESYKTCTAIRASRKKTVEAKTTWFVIAAIVGGCLFVLVSGLYCLHRRNSKHIKKSKIKSVSPVRVLVPIAEEKSDSKLIDPSD